MQSAGQGIGVQRVLPKRASMALMRWLSVGWEYSR